MNLFFILIYAGNSSGVDAPPAAGKRTKSPLPPPLPSSTAAAVLNSSTAVDLSSEFLPDVLPAGSDLVHLALPIFLEEPADAFIIKGRPAELSCRVAHALSVHFQCNDEVQKQTTTEDHVEPETGIRYTQARVEISLYQVEEFFADYHCACVALSGQGHSKSRLALVMVPFLKREFVTPPYAVQTVEGKQVSRRIAHLSAYKFSLLLSSSFSCKKIACVGSRLFEFWTFLGRAQLSDLPIWT